MFIQRLPSIIDAGCMFVVLAAMHLRHCARKRTTREYIFSSHVQIATCTHGHLFLTFVQECVDCSKFTINTLSHYALALLLLLLAVQARLLHGAVQCCVRVRVPCLTCLGAVPAAQCTAQCSVWCCRAQRTRTRLTKHFSTHPLSPFPSL